MKNLTFTPLLIFMLFSANLFAGHDLSVLNIRTFNNTPIMIELDGQKINHHPVPVLTIDDLAAGKHRLRIYRISGHGWKNTTREKLFDGVIFIDHFSEISAVLDVYRRIRIESVRPLAPAYSHSGYYNNNGYNYGGYGNQNNYGNYYDYGYGNSDNYNNGYHDPYYNIMRQDEFEHLKRMIQRTSFESTQLQIAKQAVRDNNVSAAQVRDLMMLFSFESTKVEFAKYAYDSVVDKNRFYIIYDAFTFSSSIDEMERFLQKK